MARPSSGIIKEQLEVQLPIELTQLLRQMFYDPITQRTKVGARSAYIERLIREDLAAKDPSA